MSWTALAGLAGQVFAANQANQAQQEYADQIKKLIELAQKKYGALQTPDLKDVEYAQLGPSAIEGIQGDPRLKQEEFGALDALKDMEKSGGLTLEDEAALNRVLNKTARQDAAGRGAIANDFAARGQLGSGAQLAMSLSNQ